jgi:hypothetical protein
MPGIAAFIAAGVGVAIGRGVAVAIIAGLAVGIIVGVAITGVGFAVAVGVGAPLPESPTPDADAVAMVASTPPTTIEAATNSSFSFRMIYPLTRLQPPRPLVGDQPEAVVQAVDGGNANVRR